MGAKKAGKKKNIVLRVILGILIALILIVGIYFLYVFKTYHRIEDQQDLEVTKGSTTEACAVGKEYNVISYNIGFGAYTPDFSYTGFLVLYGRGKVVLGEEQGERE